MKHLFLLPSISTCCCCQLISKACVKKQSLICGFCHGTLFFSDSAEAWLVQEQTGFEPQHPWNIWLAWSKHASPIFLCIEGPHCWCQADSSRPCWERTATPTQFGKHPEAQIQHICSLLHSKGTLLLTPASLNSGAWWLQPVWWSFYLASMRSCRVWGWEWVRRKQYVQTPSAALIPLISLSPWESVFWSGLYVCLKITTSTAKPKCLPCSSLESCH